MGNGLKWVFEVSRKEVDKLPNIELKDKIIRFREVQSELGPANIGIHVNFIANAESDTISDELLHEKQKIESEYSSGVFESFTINFLGVDELMELSKSRDRRARSVNVDLKIKYDTNTPSLII